jgi:Fe-S-cluster-containing dehydrogenase component
MRRPLRAAFSLDIDRCTGCCACAVACMECPTQALRLGDPNEPGLVEESLAARRLARE